MVSEALNEVLELLRRRLREPVPEFRPGDLAGTVSDILDYLQRLTEDVVPERVEEEADESIKVLDRIHVGPGLVADRTPGALMIAAAEKPAEAALMPPEPTIFRVKVTKDGGDAGDVDTTCSFTYTVKDLGGEVLDTALTPEKDRIKKVSYNEPDADSPGLAYYDEDGNLHLYEALDEVPVAEETTIVTDIQYDWTMRPPKFQKKTQKVRILEKEAESGWIDWLELEDECDV